jgi:hypothetical protein
LDLVDREAFAIVRYELASEGLDQARVARERRGYNLPLKGVSLARSAQRWQSVARSQRVHALQQDSLFVLTEALDLFAAEGHEHRRNSLVVLDAMRESRVRILIPNPFEHDISGRGVGHH